MRYGVKTSMNKIWKLFIPLTIILLLASCVGTDVNKDNGNDNPTTYKVTFYVDGEIVTTKYTSGDVILYDGEELNKEGYVFTGWYLDANFNTPFNNEDINKDTSLYAKFEAIEYQITYNFDYEGVVNTNKTTYTIEDGQSLTLVNPSLEGYEFTGWYYYGNLLEDNILELSDEDIYVSGEFKPIEYNITYHTNLGNYDYLNEDSYSIEDIITFKNPTRVGYLFEGWYLDSEYQTKVTSTEGLSGDIELYAKFSFAEYSIEIKGIASMVYEGPLGYNFLTETFNIPIPKADGYTFLGYYSDEAYTDLVSVGEVEVKKNSEGNIVLYAKFIPITMTYDKPSVIKLDSKGEEFNLVVTTVNNVKYEVTYNYLQELEAGTAVDVQIVVRDELGNVLESEIIEDVKVYDKPNITFTQTQYTFSNEKYLSNYFKATDSFGETLTFEISDVGELIKNQKVHVVVTATDVANNITTLELDLIYAPTEKVIELHYEDKIADILTIDDNQIIFDESVYLYLNINNKIIAYSDGILLEELEDYTVVYAIKESELEDHFNLIETADDLNNVRNDLEASYYMIADVDLKDVEFEPIGTNNDPFTGNFYGNNHKISNLTITATDESPQYGYYGLFAYLDGLVCDLELENAQIILDFKDSYLYGTKTTYAGLLAASALDNSIVSNITISGSIKNSVISSIIKENQYYVGLLFGMAFGISYTNVLVDGDIVIDAQSKDANIGGLIGYVGTNDNDVIPLIKESRANVNIRINVAGYKNSFYIMVGGLVGYTKNLMISNSYANINISLEMKIKQTYTSYLRVGGLIGQCGDNYRCDVDIISSFAVGLINMNNVTCRGYVGSLIGYVNYNNSSYYTSLYLSNTFTVVDFDYSGYKYYDLYYGIGYINQNYSYYEDELLVAGDLVPTNEATSKSEEEILGLDNLKRFSSNIWYIKENMPPIFKCELDGVEDHTLYLVQPKEATCYEEGNIAYYKCYTCDKLFSSETKEEIVLEDVIIPITHSLKFYDEIINDCLSQSNHAYYQCTKCYKCFADEEAKTELDSSEIYYYTGHDLTKHDYLAPTCEENGNLEYYYCETCHKYYFDESAQEQTNSNDVSLGKLNHNYVFKETILPNFSERTDGYDLYVCENDNSHTKQDNVVEWESLGINISFVAEGNNLKSIFVEKGLDHYDLPTPTKEHYDFVGWYLDKDYTEILSYPILNDVTLYAKFEKSSYDVIYMLNGEEYYKESYLYEETVEKIADPILEPPYLFMGWFTDETYETEYDFSNIVEENIKLYAKVIEYKINSIELDEKFVVKESDLLDATYFNATAVDIFDEEVPVVVSIIGEQKAGQTITVNFDATKNGVTSSFALGEVKVYGDIQIQEPSENLKIKLSDVENYKNMVVATDSFNEPLTVSYTYPNEFKAGISNEVKYTVEDVAKNTASGSYYLDIYDIPTINYIQPVIYEGQTAENVLYVVDSFGQRIEFETIVSGNIIENSIINITVDARDEVNNILYDTIEYYVVSRDIEYVPYEYGYQLVSYSKDVSSVEIPESLVGKKVLSIADEVFADSVLADIVLPNGIINIGNYAFKNCSNLTSITLPNSLKEIGIFILNGCSNIQSLTIPAIKGKTIGNLFGTDDDYNQASWVPKSLDTLTIIGGTEIPDLMAYGLTSITNITLPNSLEKIGDSAFYNTGIEHITISSSIKEYGTYVFANNEDLLTVEIDYIEYNSSNNQLNRMFADCPKLTTVTLGSNVKYIVPYMFYECTSLKNINIDSSKVTHIGDGAFSGCKALVSLSIPKTVDYVGSRAFNDCSSLQTLYIPVVSEIHSVNLLDGCSSLQTLTIPYFGNNEYQKTSEANQYPLGYYFSTSSFTNTTAVSQSYHGSSTTTYVTRTYYIPNSLTKVTVLNGNIFDGAFENCTSITSVTLGSQSIIRGEIGATAFKGCTNLNYIYIHDGTYSTYGITRIKENAFIDCQNLTTARFSDGHAWYCRESETSGEIVTLSLYTAGSKVPTYLKETYVSYYWYKSV